MHKRESKKKYKSTTVILFHINKIKWYIGHSDYLGLRSIVPSEYCADTLNKYCYHSFLSYFPYDTKAVEQNISVIFQMHTNHYFHSPNKEVSLPIFLIHTGLSLSGLISRTNRSHTFYTDIGFNI